MPLEIRELIIRVTVNEKKSSHDEFVLTEKLQELKAKVVKECMEKLSVRFESMNER